MWQKPRNGASNWKVMQFYIMEDLGFSSQYAYGEEADPVILGEAELCPVCNSPMTPLKWLNPKYVVLEKPKYGDFVYGTFYTFLVSENFKNRYEQSDLTGITKFDPVIVKKVKRLRDNSPKPPRYYYVEIVISDTRVDEEKSNFVWDRVPTCDYCRNGIIKSHTGFIIKEDTWTGEDIFYARGHGGVIVVTERFKQFVEKNKFTNYRFIKSEEYQPLWVRPIGGK